MVRSTTLALCLLLGALANGSAAEAVLLDFYLPTCGPCRQMAPTVSRLEADGFAVRKVDGSREPQLAQRYGVTGYPTFVMVVDGQEAGKIVGPTSYEQLKGLFSKRAQNGIRPVSSSTPSTFGPQGEDFRVGVDAGPGARQGAAAPGQRRPAAGEASSASPADAALLNASVRLRVEDAAGHSFGTGTIVDAQRGEALVVTCAHLFRDGAGAVIETGASAELFRATPSGLQVVERAEAQLLSYDFDADVALVAIRPSREVATAQVAGPQAVIQQGAPVRSVGCDLGADPTVRRSQVTALNRYQGAPNIEASGAPIEGRSGGGLFSERGELIGVCFAADEEGDEGLYSGLASIHAQLDKLNLQAVYHPRPKNDSAPSVAPASLPRRSAAADAESVAQAAPVRRGATTWGDGRGQLAPVPTPPGAASLVRGQDPVAPRGDGPAGLSAREEAVLEEVASRAVGSQVVIILPPEEPGGRNQVLTLENVSPEFLKQMKEMPRRSERNPLSGVSYSQ